MHARACPCPAHRVGFHLWQVVASLQAFQHASELQKVALEVIAYSTPPSKMAELRQLFHHMDTDDTGSITKEQFRHAMSQHPEIPLAQVDLMFASMDQTHTGQVDYTEFMAACLFSHRRRFETGASFRPQPRGPEPSPPAARAPKTPRAPRARTPPLMRQLSNLYSMFIVIVYLCFHVRMYD